MVVFKVLACQFWGSRILSNICLSIVVKIALFKVIYLFFSQESSEELMPDDQSTFWKIFVVMTGSLFGQKGIDRSCVFF